MITATSLLAGEFNFNLVYYYLLYQAWLVVHPYMDRALYFHFVLYERYLQAPNVLYMEVFGERQQIIL
jgi:hypothetical protein